MLDDLCFELILDRLSDLLGQKVAPFGSVTEKIEICLLFRFYFDIKRCENV